MIMAGEGDDEVGFVRSRQIACLRSDSRANGLTLSQKKFPTLSKLQLRKDFARSRVHDLLNSHDGASSPYHIRCASGFRNHRIDFDRMLDYCLCSTNLRKLQKEVF